MADNQPNPPVETSSVTFARELAGRPGRPAPRWAPPDLQNPGVDVSVLCFERRARVL